MCGQNELEVCTTLTYPHISSFRTHTRIFKPSEDSEPSGLKADIAGRLVTMMMMMMVMMMMMMGGVKGGVCSVGEPGHVLLCAVMLSVANNTLQTEPKIKGTLDR